VPHALLHNLKHNKVLHERVMLLTVRIEDVPYVAEEKRARDQGLWRRLLPRSSCATASWRKSTFPAALAKLKGCGNAVQDDGHQLLPRPPDAARLVAAGMAIWREKLFAWMLRNAESAMEFFKLPTNRVVELGSQVEI
jgi:KUP system potassium uptake protein